MEVYPAIMAMELAGFPVDLTRLEDVRTDLEQRIADVEEAAWKMAGDQFALSNYDAKRWVMFGEGKKEYGKHKILLKSQNLRPRGRTPVENLPQVTGAVLEYYSDRGNKMAELLGRWAELEKLRGTFIEGMSTFLHAGPGLPTLHTSYKQHGTKTGRLSSSKPNLQQLPEGRRDPQPVRGWPRPAPDRGRLRPDRTALRWVPVRRSEMIQVFKDGRGHPRRSCRRHVPDPLEEGDLRPQAGWQDPELRRALRRRRAEDRHRGWLLLGTGLRN